MMLRLGDDTTTVNLAFPFSSGTDSGSPVVDASSLPSFCDPTWTAINGGVCTDAMGQYRTATGAQVTGDQILAALKVPTSASSPAAASNPFASVSTSTFLMILAAVLLFMLLVRR